MTETPVKHHGTIEFDENYFLNKSGIESLGFSTTDNEAIYNYLISQNRTKDGIKGLVFYNSATNIRLLPKTLKHYREIQKYRLGHDPIEPFQGKFLNSFFSGVINLAAAVFNKNKCTSVKLVGFFNIEKPYKYRGNYYHVLTPFPYAYLDNELLYNPNNHIPIHVPIDHIVSDEENNIRLPKTVSKEDLLTRALDEYYFSERDVFRACALHFPHRSDLSLPFTPTEVYARGNTEECSVSIEELNEDIQNEVKAEGESSKSDYRNSASPKACLLYTSPSPRDS